MNKKLRTDDLFRNVFVLYINSSLHVAVAVTGFVFVTSIHLDVVVQPVLYVFICSSSVIGYNITRYGYLFSKIDYMDRFLQIGIYTITGISLLVLAGSAFYLSLTVLGIAGILGSITLMYSHPFFDGKLNLRSIFGIKTIVIALTWAGVTVGLPVLNEYPSGVAGFEIMVEAIQRFLFVVVLILPFDIRDARTDGYSLGTVPQLFGIKKTRVLAGCLLAVVVLLKWFKNQEMDMLFLILVLISIATLIMVWKSVYKQTEYFASFWVEGIPIAWALILWFVSI